MSNRSDQPAIGSRRSKPDGLVNDEASFGSSSVKARKSVGGTGVVAQAEGSLGKPGPVPLGGEAVPSIEKHEQPRASAQERVFGELIGRWLGVAEG